MIERTSPWLILALLSLSGCDKNSEESKTPREGEPMEEAEEWSEQAAEDTADALDEAADETEDALEEAGDEVESAFDDD